MFNKFKITSAVLNPSKKYLSFDKCKNVYEHDIFNIRSMLTMYPMTLGSAIIS